MVNGKTSINRFVIVKISIFTKCSKRVYAQPKGINHHEKISNLCYAGEPSQPIEYGDHRSDDDS
jgi:hypothetical protein